MLNKYLEYICDVLIYAFKTSEAMYPSKIILHDNISNGIIILHVFSI
uniref:Lon protease-like protein n=1 Tax=Moumouvirus sp. 'Monve' TaxID=1128131 RepID=H2EFT0_9VIRU|nr:lon protease-like protein [Moumouvirus Monve]